VSDLSIIVVTYNCESWVGRCLESLPGALQGLDAEVVVVDNASADSSADIVAHGYPDAKLLRNAVNTGFAAAVNLGARQASSDWILLLNPDMQARPGSLRALYEFAQTTPGRGLYGGRTLRPDGGVEPSSCWDLPTLWSTFCFAAGLSTLRPRSTFFDPESMGTWARDSVREVGMITGCLLLVPREVWNSLGGLDERYFVYGEDADFSARARAAGWRPTITPDAEVVHAIGISSNQSSSKMPLLLAGKITYAQTHFDGVARVAAIWLLRAGVAVRAFGSRLTKRGGKWGDAWTQRSSWWDGFGKRASQRDPAS